MSKETDSTTLFYRFGDAELDPSTREFRRGGEAVSMQPRVFDLLLYLVTNRDRAVDKDELLEAVWPGRVITETALTRAIMKVRRAIGDDASTQESLKTLHGHGYRFVAEVETCTVAPDQNPDSSDTTSDGVTGTLESADKTAKTNGNGQRKPFLLAAIASAALALIAWFVWQQQSAPTVSPGEIRIAVLPVDDLTADPELGWSQLGLMGFVSGLIAQDSVISTVPNAGVVDLYERVGPQAGDLLEPGAVQEVADKLSEVYGATHLLLMQLSPDQGQLRIRFALLDSQGGVRQGTTIGTDPTALARGVVQDLSGHLLGRSHFGETGRTVSADPFNNEAFSRGIGLSIRGECADAVNYFRMLREQEPALTAPRFELAYCLRILGENEEAEELLLQLVAEQEQEAPSADLARSLMTLGVLYNRTGRLDEAQSTHERALAVAQSVQDEDLSGRILLNLAIVAEDKSDWATSTELLNRAKLAYQRAGRVVLPGQVHSLEANLAMGQGKLAEAEQHLELAVNAFRAAGDRRNEGMMLNNSGYLRRLQGKMDEAEQFHLQSLAIREEIGDRVGVGRVHNMLATVYSAKGDYARAVDEATAAIEIARETDDTLFEATALAQLASSLESLGELGAARESYRQSGAAFMAIQDRMRAMQVSLRLAHMDLRQGDVELARQTADKVLAQSRESDLVQPELDAMELLGDIAYQENDLDTADIRYAEAITRVQETSWTGKETKLLGKRANVLMDQSRLEEAEPLVGALSTREPSVRILKIQARYAFLNEESDLAVTLMEQARELAGDAWDLENETLLNHYGTSL